MKSNLTDSESLNSFFSFVSKVVIVIPIFIVVVSLFFKFSQPKNGTILGIEKSTQIPIQTPNLGVSTNKNSIKFDLQGPIVCDNLFILNKNIFLKNKSTNYLLRGDCLYTWDNGKISGQKKCGLLPYIGMAENFLGFMSINDLINNSMVQEKIKDKDIDLVSIIKSCKREEIRNKGIFEIPKQILFANKQ